MGSVSLTGIRQFDNEAANIKYTKHNYIYTGKMICSVLDAAAYVATGGEWDSCPQFVISAPRPKISNKNSVY